MAPGKTCNKQPPPTSPIFARPLGGAAALAADAALGRPAGSVARGAGRRVPARAKWRPLERIRPLGTWVPSRPDVPCYFEAPSFLVVTLLVGLVVGFPNSTH